MKWRTYEREQMTVTVATGSGYHSLCRMCGEWVLLVIVRPEGMTDEEAINKAIEEAKENGTMNEVINSCAADAPETVKEIDLVEHQQEWVKPKQEQEFWKTAKRLNIMFLLANIPDQDKSRMIHDIVVLVKLAQMAAFRDGLRRGKQEAAQRIASECKKTASIKRWSK